MAHVRPLVTMVSRPHDGAACGVCARVLRRVRRFVARLRDDERGVVMLETVLVFPLQLLVVMAIIQIAEMYVAADVVNYAAFQAARTTLVNLRGASNTQDVHDRAYRTAWIITSTLNNAGTGGMRLRVPLNKYRYPAPNSAEARLAVELIVGAASEPTVEQTDSVISAELTYWYDLTVPVGGPFIYSCLQAIGAPTRVNPATGVGEMQLAQNCRLPKPWPH